jgi:peptide chain release factor 1
VAFNPSDVMIKRLDEIERRYIMLTDQLSQAEVVNNRDEFSKLSKEHRSFEETVQVFRKFRQALKDYEGARSVLSDSSDKELRELANMELSELEPELTQLEKDLQKLLLPKDPNDAKNSILEVRAGVGGDEAGLFCADLFRAYQRYAEKLGWRFELLALADNSAGGYKEAIALIEGDSVYSKLKYESGVHRVQRVPKTEASGRIHTSTITVAVLPEAEDVDVNIDPNDLRIDVYRAGGKGGQSVNTTDSAVRITHIPTGEVVICQDEKSQLKNKNKAMKVLRSRLLEKAIEEQESKMSAERRAQVGAGFRNERIRTYNFPQGRVTDHRIGLTTHNIAGVLNGDFSEFTQSLIDYYQMQQLKNET